MFHFVKYAVIYYGYYIFLKCHFITPWLKRFIAVIQFERDIVSVLSKNQETCSFCLQFYIAVLCPWF